MPTLASLVALCFSTVNSMIFSDIWHKYHEWYFKIVIRNFTGRQAREIKTILKYHKWYLCQISRTNHYNCETFTRFQDFVFYFSERFLVRSFTIIFMFHTSLCYSYLQHLIRMRTFCCIILWVVTNKQPAETLNTNN